MNRTHSTITVVLGVLALVLLAASSACTETPTPNPPAERFLDATKDGAERLGSLKRAGAAITDDVVTEVMTPVYAAASEANDEVESWKIAPASETYMSTEREALRLASGNLNDLVTELHGFAATEIRVTVGPGEGPVADPPACYPLCMDAGRDCLASCDAFADTPSAYLIPLCKTGCSRATVSCLNGCDGISCQ